MQSSDVNKIRPSSNIERSTAALLMQVTLVKPERLLETLIILHLDKNSSIREWYKFNKTGLGLAVKTRNNSGFMLFIGRFDMGYIVGL